MSLLDTASLVVTPNGTKAGKLYSVVPSSGAGDLSVTRATTATRVNSSGLIESVASNVPRLDYTNGSCPSILVEPQRTNISLYSEQFDNASWSKVTTTILANEIVSPDGTLSADKLQEDNSNAQHRIDQTTTSVIGTNTFSVFAKKAERNFIFLRIGTSGAHFNLTDGSISSISGVTAYIEEYNNGWFKCIITRTSTVVNEIVRINIIENAPITNYQGISGYGIYIWGAQLEAGSYATSYIPTTSASVTRNADVISKTGISSLIGQTEGTLFVDFDYDGVSNNYILMQLFDSSTPFNRIQLYLNSLKKIFFQAVGSGAGSISDTNILSIGRNKIAGAYKNNDFVLYINGTQIGTDMSGSVIATNSITLNDLYAIPSIYKQVMDINLSALWKTRLTNTQLAQLTTI
jgi:hypothetical protein